MDPLPLIVMILGLGAGSAVLAVLGIRKLRLAVPLGSPLTLDTLKDHLDEIVVVHGRPEPEKQIRIFDGIQVLWRRRTRQQLRAGYRHRHWADLKDEVDATDFLLHFPDGGRVRVLAPPTRVQDPLTRHSGVQGGMMTTGGERTMQWYLPLISGLTVKGRLRLGDQGAEIVADPEEGLFFSPHEPRTAARRMRYLGLSLLLAAAGLDAVAALLLVVVLTA